MTERPKSKGKFSGKRKCKAGAQPGGLLRGSFRPPDAICKVREVHRECSELIGTRTEAIQRMQKALDQMNVQVHRALTDITGKPGMRIIRAIVAGERDPHQFAEHRDKRCGKSKAQIAEHLTGTWGKEHRFNLQMALKLYDQIEEIIETYQGKISEMLEALVPIPETG